MVLVVNLLHTLYLIFNSCLRYTIRDGQNGGGKGESFYIACTLHKTLVINKSPLIFFFLSFFLPQVKTLKERIEQEKGMDNFSVAGQKLIYAGMINEYIRKTSQFSKA